MAKKDKAPAKQVVSKAGSFRVTEDEKAFNEAVAHRLSEAMTEGRHTNVELGRTLNIHGATIGNIRTAKSRINGYHLFRIAQAIDVDVAYLLTGHKAKVRSKVAPNVELSTRENPEFEICWDCGSKKRPTQCAGADRKRYYMCGDCYAQSTAVEVTPALPELDRVAWNAMSKRERFKFEKECVAASLSALDPQANSEDAQRAVLLGLEAARLIAE